MSRELFPGCRMHFISILIGQGELTKDPAEGRERELGALSLPVD